MRIAPTLAALAASCALAAPCPARPPEAPKFPDTPIGRSARALIDAVNGDAAAIDRFVAAHLAADLDRQGMRTFTASTYAGMFHKLRAQSGGLAVLHVREQNEPGTLAALCTSKQGEHRLVLDFREDVGNPGRLRSVELHPMVGPPQKSAWPEGTLDEAGVAAALERRFAAAADQDRFSGVVLVAQGDRVLVHRGYGMADRGRGVANTPGTRMHTGSLGKMFTGVAIGQLVEAGKLRFDDRLDAVLPEYPDPQAKRVAIRHLLTHTSGIADPFASPRRVDGRRYPTAWDNIGLIAGIPLEFEPGARHGYSNGNFAVLAAVVEKVSGLPYGDYVRERIYGPAGMAAADPDRDRDLPHALGYAHLPETDPLGLEPKRPTVETAGAIEPAETSGFGGLYLTAEDVYRFLRALRDGRLLGPAMTEEVTRGRVDVAPGAPVRYGYGFYEIGMWGTPTRGHSGGGGNSGIGAHAEALWDRRAYVVILGNVDLEFVRPLTGDVVGFLARQSGGAAEAPRPAAGPR